MLPGEWQPFQSIFSAVPLSIGLTRLNAPPIFFKKIPASRKLDVKHSIFHTRFLNAGRGIPPPPNQDDWIRTCHLVQSRHKLTTLVIVEPESQANITAHSMPVAQQQSSRSRFDLESTALIPTLGCGRQLSPHRGCFHAFNSKQTFSRGFLSPPMPTVKSPCSLSQAESHFQEIWFPPWQNLQPSAGLTGEKNPL